VKSGFSLLKEPEFRSPVSTVVSVPFGGAGRTLPDGGGGRWDIVAALVRSSAVIPLDEA
jgi:hypothetical protein